MSIKSKVLATAATLAMVGGVGTAGVLGTAAAANAATPSCGFTCVNIFSQEFGHHSNPNFILDVQGGRIHIGQNIILFRGSNADKAEDFRLEFQGTVAQFFEAGMVSAAFALHYGCVIGDFSSCFGLTTVPLGFPGCSTSSPNFIPGTRTCVANFDDPAFEIEYTPNGVDSGLCVGVASTAVQEEGVTLQQCGASSKTVWAVDIFDQPVEFFFLHYAPLINGSDTNFSHPFVLTYPQSGFPTDRPRPQLQVDNLTGFTNGFPPILNFPSINSNQMWGADFGPFVFEGVTG